MSEKIKPHHLQRLALVYVRLSSPGQVERNIESLQRQAALKKRAVSLGWPEERVRIIDSDLGITGKTTLGRQGYHELLEAIVKGEVGLILSIDAGRFGRNNAKWHALLEECIYSDVLVANDEHVYDPKDRHDLLQLGLQGVLADFEGRTLQHRMQECWWQKARRGEMNHRYPPGYISHPKARLEKHPNRRVQHALELLFAAADRFPSARKLTHWLVEEEYRLPVVEDLQRPLEISWVKSTYGRILAILKNPRYTGTYVIGETRTVIERTAEGPRRKRISVPREQWEVVLPNHHPAYITQEQYEKNLAKILENTTQKGDRVKGAPQEGESLMAGLLHCKRCGHKMQVRCRGEREVSYRCVNGGKRRDGFARGCFDFAARRPDQRFAEAILHVVRPAGIEAALQAETLLAQEHQSRRQTFVDTLEQYRYEAERARRQYDRVEPENRLVAAELETQWNEALKMLKAQEARLADFDQKPREVPTPEQRRELRELGAHLDRAWYHPQASMAYKKQIVRHLVEQIWVDIDEARDEIVLLIHWKGGHHTELRESRRYRKKRNPPQNLKAILESLRKVLDDKAMANALNRAEIPTERGECWTTAKVKAFRQRHQIRAFDEAEKKEHGWLTQEETATRLAISPMSVHRLVQWRILPAEQPLPGLPSIILTSALVGEEVKKAVKQIQRNLNRPLPEDPNQLSLWGTTNR